MSVGVFNHQQWSDDHDRRDDDRFKALNDSVTNIWRIFAFMGVTFVALSGWSLKNQYDQIANQNRVLHAVYGVSNQVQQVQSTTVPNTPK